MLLKCNSNEWGKINKSRFLDFKCKNIKIKEIFFSRTRNLIFKSDFSPEVELRFDIPKAPTFKVNSEYGVCFRCSSLSLFRHFS